ncbi:MAG: hypothetical protein WAN36_15635, partial [Calditrichia bacterium]
MKAIITILIIFFWCLMVPAENWLTYYEESGFKKTPRYQQTIEFARRLDSAAVQVIYRSFGISPQGRELPLLIVD